METTSCEPDTKSEDTAQQLGLHEIDNILSSLGMLSESFLELTPEERILVSSHSLAVKAAKNKKVNEMKEKKEIKQSLLERKAELDKKFAQHDLVKQPLLTADGQKIGKRKRIKGLVPKKAVNKYELDYSDEDYDIYEYSDVDPTVVVEDSNPSEYDQLQLALKISNLEYSLDTVNKKSNIIDIRKAIDITPGLAVEIVEFGMEETMQRTRGIVVSVISKRSFDSRGISVELEYGIRGRITAISGNKPFIAADLFSTFEEDEETEGYDDEEEEIVPASKIPPLHFELLSLCPVGCGTNLTGFTDHEINEHVDLCLLGA